MRASSVVSAATILLIGAVGPLTAQASPVQRGSIRLAGGASITHASDRDTDQASTSLAIAPDVGYFVAPGVAVELGASYSHLSAGGSTANGVAVGPGLTVYPWTAPSRLYPFVSGRLQLGRLSGTSSVQGQDATTTTTTWSVGGGVLLMAGAHVGISGELYYQRNRNKLTRGSVATVDHTEAYGLRWGVVAFVL